MSQPGIKATAQYAVETYTERITKHRGAHGAWCEHIALGYAIDHGLNDDEYIDLVGAVEAVTADDNYCPPGYKMSGGRRMVDHAYSRTITDAFQMFADGMNIYQIAKRFNDEKRPSPSKAGGWGYRTVECVLETQFYAYGDEPIVDMGLYQKVVAVRRGG